MEKLPDLLSILYSSLHIINVIIAKVSRISKIFRFFLIIMTDDNFKMGIDQAKNEIIKRKLALILLVLYHLGGILLTLALK